MKKNQTIDKITDKIVDDIKLELYKRCMEVGSEIYHEAIKRFMEEMSQ